MYRKRRSKSLGAGREKCIAVSRYECWSFLRAPKIGKSIRAARILESAPDLTKVSDSMEHREAARASRALKFIVSSESLPRGELSSGAWLGIVRVHLVPALGATRLDTIPNEDVQQVLTGVDAQSCRERRAVERE